MFYPKTILNKIYNLRAIGVFTILTGHSLFSQNVKTDSLLNKKPFSQIETDLSTQNTLREKAKEKFTGIKDSLNIPTKFSPSVKGQLPKNKFKQIISPALETSGKISVGYEYGWLPYAYNAKTPLGNYKAEGELSFSAFHMPLKLNFFYSDVKYNTGLNNNFRISYDLEKYKEEQLNKISKEINTYTDEMADLQKKQQVLQQKLIYMNNQKHKLDLEKNIPTIDQHLPDINKPNVNLISTNLNNLNIPSTPSLPQTPQLPGIDSIQNELLSKNPIIKDSSVVNVKKKLPYDSVTAKINNYKTELSNIQSSLQEKREKINTLKEMYKNPMASNPFASKKENFLKGIKKLEIGLCYPSYSTYLVSNMPVKGINVLYEKNDWFTAFTCGTTVSNLLFSSTPMQNVLQNAKNLYNAFDFSNLEGGRKIAVVKTGWGKREKTHVHFGFLFGTGLTSYIRNPEGTPITAYGTERNMVVELDIKYELTKNHSLDIIYGKSTIQDLSISPLSTTSSMQKLIDNDHTNSALIRYNGFIPKYKTKITLTSRYIEPFFRSFGVAYMRSDNLRYEAKVEQPLNSKFKYTGSFRYDTDNLLRLYQYKTRLYTLGNNLQWKATRRLTIRVAYNPVLQEIQTGTELLKNKNAIANAVISYVPKTKKSSVQLTGIYSYYNITSDSLQLHFQNVTITEQTQLNNGFRYGITSSWFKNSLVDSLGNNTLINVLDGGYQFKKGTTVSVAAKAALYKMSVLQTGFSVRSGFTVYKNLSMELQAEKLVAGEYYNLYNTEQNIQNYPYYFMGRLTIKW